MQLFYFDKEMSIKEKNLDYIPIILHLEKLFEQSKECKILVTIIAYTWYYYVEGRADRLPADYDWEFFSNKWQQYLELGKKEYFDYPDYCYIAGYTMYLHGAFINSGYKECEKLGIQLMRECLKKAQGDLRILSQHFFEKNKKKTPISLDVCAKLFPSDSGLDKYFREICK